MSKTYDPNEVIKEDPLRRAGRTPENAKLYPKTVEQARLAIADCEDTCDAATESLEEKIKEAQDVTKGK